MGFTSQVFVIDGVTCKLIANGGFATTEAVGNVPDAVAFVMQYLDFVTFVLGEMYVVLSSYHTVRYIGAQTTSMLLHSSDDPMSVIVKNDRLGVL